MVIVIVKAHHHEGHVIQLTSALWLISYYIDSMTVIFFVFEYYIWELPSFEKKSAPSNQDWAVFYHITQSHSDESCVPSAIFDGVEVQCLESVGCLIAVNCFALVQGQAPEKDATAGQGKQGTSNSSCLGCLP